MGDVHIEFRRGSLAEVLRSDGVRQAVSAAAHRMALSARGRTRDDVVVNDAGRSRARSYVVRLGSGEAGEAHDRVLGSSVDAGRQ